MQKWNLVHDKYNLVQRCYNLKLGSIYRNKLEFHLIQVEKNLIIFKVNTENDIVNWS